MDGVGDQPNNQSAGRPVSEPDGPTANRQFGLAQIWVNNFSGIVVNFSTSIMADVQLNGFCRKKKEKKIATHTWKVLLYDLRRETVT